MVELLVLARELRENLVELLQSGIQFRLEPRRVRARLLNEGAQRCYAPRGGRTSSGARSKLGNSIRMLRFEPRKLWGFIWVEKCISQTGSVLLDT